MVRILCPFCDQEFELENDLSGEYLCPICDETVLYENNDVLEEPIVFGKYSIFFTLENILTGLLFIIFSIATVGIVAFIALLVFGAAGMNDKREINRRMIAGDPYPEKIAAYGIRIDVNKKMKLLHWKQKNNLSFTRTRSLLSSTRRDIIMADLYCLKRVKDSSKFFSMTHMHAQFEI